MTRRFPDLQIPLVSGAVIHRSNGGAGFTCNSVHGSALLFQCNDLMNEFWEGGGDNPFRSCLVNRKELRWENNGFLFSPSVFFSFRFLQIHHIRFLLI